MNLNVLILMQFVRIFAAFASDFGVRHKTPVLFNPAAIRWPLSATDGATSVPTNDNVTTIMPEERKLLRGKRYLDFEKGTRMSWRLTVKNTILKVNTLWAYGFGMRTNYPFQDKKDRLRPFFKRDVLHGVADLFDGHGFDGQACLLKSYCTALLDVDTQIGGGMLFKLLKVIFSLNAAEQRHFPYMRPEHCQQILHSHCPLSFNSISPYTDDV